MIFSFLIGIVLRLLNVIISMIPPLGNIVGSLGTALSYFIGQAIPWDFLFPINEGLGLIVLVIKFEIGIMIFIIGRWIIEMIRGK